MKFLIFSHSSAKGGAEIALDETIDGLRECGHDITVIIPGDGYLAQVLKEKKILYYSTPYKHIIAKKWTIYKILRYCIFEIYSLLKLHAILYKKEFDIVITNTTTISIGIFFSILKKCAHLIYIHEINIEKYGYTYLFRNENWFRFVGRHSFFALTVSNFVKKENQKYFLPEKIQSIYQSVTPVSKREIHFNSNFPKRIISVGAINEGKNQKEVILALDLLIKEGHSIELLLVGSGEEEYVCELKSLAQKLRLTSFLQFFGAVSNPFDYIKASDVLVNCSYNEAFGRVTIEGMLAGTTVVAPNAGGHSELILDNWNGVLYEPGDVESLAEKIKWVLTHSIETAVINENAKSWAEKNFSRSEYVKNLKSFFKKVEISLL